MQQPPRQPGRRSPAPLFDDLLLEILLRVPPGDPARLARLSLVSKSWRRLLADPAFRRLYRDFHWRPTVLGFFHNEFYDDTCTWLAHYFPITSAFRPPRPAEPDRVDWYALDARHGRVLFHTINSTEKLPALLVWDPIADSLWGVPFPAVPFCIMNAAVFCAIDGCNHLDCHGGPFRVAFVGTEEVTSACVYSSEAGAWSEPITIEHPGAVEMLPNALVGDTVYFPCNPREIIVEYDMGRQELNVVEVPFVYKNTVLMVAEGGVLGFAGVQESRLYLWSRETRPNGTVAWAQRRVIELEPLLPAGETIAHPVGFADGAGVIFLQTGAGVITIELKSYRVREMSTWESIDSVIPYMRFYTPVKGIPESGHRGRVQGSKCQRVAN